MSKRKFTPVPVHPGRVLAGILEDAGMSGNALALALRVPANRITGLVQGNRSITIDTAMRLGRYFNNTARFWMMLQLNYELNLAEKELAKTIEREVLPYREAKTSPATKAS